MHFKTISVALVATLTCHGALAMETDRFRSIVADTITQVESGTVDADALIELQEQLVAIGVDGAREYAAASPENAQLMTFVADSATDMVAMDLNSIEAAWHDGEALEEIGVSIDDLDHFGAAISHMDAVVHPATAIIALREYKASGDKGYLLQVKDELSEVVEHLSHLE